MNRKVNIPRNCFCALLHQKRTLKTEAHGDNADLFDSPAKGYHGSSFLKRRWQRKRKIE
jgi:hypothetical protein